MRRLSRTAGFALAMAATAATAAQYVQSTCANLQAQPSISAALLESVDAGDTVVVALNTTAAAPLVSLGDWQLNGYWPVGPPVALNSNNVVQLFVATGVDGGMLDVRATFSGSAAFVAMYVDELAGVDPVNPIDATASDSGFGAILSTQIAGDPNGLLFAYALSTESVQDAGPPFVVRERCSADVTADAVASSTAPVGVSFNSDLDAGWLVLVVAFRPASLGFLIDAGAAPRTAAVGCDCQESGRSAWLVGSLSMLCFALRRSRRAE